jgi:hypothetical protein
MKERVCAACGAPVPYSGVGCPRRYCSACVPQAVEVGAAAYLRAWRAVNPERERARNAARRAVPLPRRPERDGRAEAR